MGRATAEDASQIFGGRSVTQSGMGKLIENVSGFILFKDVCQRERIGTPVPSHVTVRRDPWRCRGCDGRLRGAAGS
jgi:hypothetical protein